MHQRKSKRLSGKWGVCAQLTIENQLQNKHVESLMVPCLDEGSKPSGSTLWDSFNFFENCPLFFSSKFLSIFKIYLSASLILGVQNLSLWLLLVILSRKTTIFYR